MSVCSWCRADTKLTNEHVFPDWLNNLVEAPGEPYRVKWEADSVNSSAIRRTYPSARLGQTVATVCRPCNNGWMSDLEAGALSVLKPLILYPDERSAISPAAQVAVAAWATMKVAVAEGLGGLSVFTDDQRDALRLASAPPSTGRVHVARYNNVQMSAKYLRYTGMAPAGHPLAGARATTAAYVVGPLAFLVLLSPDSTINTGAGSGESRPAWASLWPPVTPAVGWPLLESVDDAGLERLLGEVAPGMILEREHLLPARED